MLRNDRLSENAQMVDHENLHNHERFGIKLPFGLHNGRLIHVSEAEQGLACGCVCPACMQRLVARKGTEVAHHFAHFDASSCVHAFETGLHLAAKRILETQKKMRIPKVEVPFSSYKEPWIVHEECDIHFDRVEVENRLGSVVPDLLVYVDRRPLVVEIAVTHAVDSVKLKKLRDLGWSALEITLADFSRNPTLEELQEKVVCSANCKTWLYNAKAESVKRNVLRLAERKQLVERGLALHVDDCPIGARIWHDKFYANVVDDCIYCEYCADAGPSDGCGVLSCLGKRRIATYQDFVALTRIKARSMAV
jgi:hypothetical protein